MSIFLHPYHLRGDIPFIPYPKKIDICIFERSRWIDDWGAPVELENPDIYFWKVTLNRWVGCTGAVPWVPDEICLWKSVDWGAPVQFENPDIYFLKVTLNRWLGCTGAVRKSRYIFLKGHVESLTGVHRCSSLGPWWDMCLKKCWLGCTGAVRKSRYIFFKGHVDSLTGVHRCRSKSPWWDMCLK